MPSPARRTAARGWRPWSAATSSSCRWMTQRHWYRYHHLFADVLRAHLLAEQPEQVATLHRRASAWYEQHGSAADAIRHALAAGDFARAADLVERAVPAMRRSQAGGHVARLAQGAPRRGGPPSGPCSASGMPDALLVSGELEGVEDRLRDAERWLDTTADRRERPEPRGGDGRRGRRGISPSPGLDRRVPRRAGPGAGRCGRHRGTTPGGRSTSSPRTTISGAERRRRSWGSPPGRAGISRRRTGRMPRAWRSLQRAGNISDVIGCAIALADIRIAQGRLREAMRTYERALAAGDGAGRRRSCGGRRTCTWA